MGGTFAMKSKIRRLYGVLIVATGLVLLAGCQPSGVLVGAGDGKVTIRSTQDDMVTTYEVAPDAKIMRDNEPAKLDDLVSGDTVAVTVAQKGDKMVAMSVSAWSKQEPQPSGDNPPSPASPSEEQLLENSETGKSGPGQPQAPSDQSPTAPANNEDEASPEEGAPPSREGGGATIDEPRLEGEAAPPDNDRSEHP
jgi:hypothetical protein